MFCLTMSALLCIFLIEVEGSKTRHTIYWNKLMTPGLVTTNFVVHVKIGEFMDILCPQSSLLGITHRPRDLANFDLYNVTEKDFHECKTGGQRLFSCDRPERENKLTLKFQVISPSPFGFRFQYCQDYYLVAAPRGKPTEPSCPKDFTRLRLSVACQDEPSTTTTTTTTTIVPTRMASTLSRRKKEMKFKSDIIKKLQELANLMKDIEKRQGKFDVVPTVLVPNITQPSLEMAEEQAVNNGPQMLASSSEKGSHEYASSLPGSATISRPLPWLHVFIVSLIAFILSLLTSTTSALS